VNSDGINRSKAQQLICEVLAERCEQSATVREVFKDCFPLLSNLVPGFTPYRRAEGYEGSEVPNGL